MFSANNTGGKRIFISYRRADTTGYAGRLADSLETYFGKDRVFRDVGSIEPGADFADRIRHSLKEAGACLVLIGPRWLANEDGGTPRLHEPDDYVAGEIAAALESRRPVFPVLVEGATMPREEDLPQRLASLSRRNAITITDERWQADVTRLAKVIALDVTGSVTERKLTLLKSIVLGALTAVMLFILLSFSVAAGPMIPGTAGGFTPEHGLAAFITISLVSVLLISTRSLVAPESQRFVWATFLLGAGSSLTAIVYYTVFNKSVVVLFAASTCVVTVMLALLAMSGFKPNDRVS